MKNKNQCFMVCIVSLFAFSNLLANSTVHTIQQEMQHWLWQNDYHQTFLVKTKTGEQYFLAVNALQCEKYDTRCVWQDARSWIGTAIDMIGAKKCSLNEGICQSADHRCTINYTVYQTDPEQVSFQCGMGKHQLHYRTLKTFLPYYFGIP